MANNSDIIKIGFDYESGLAEFIKNYNGTMDQVQKNADGNRIEIQFDVSDKDVLSEILLCPNANVHIIYHNKKALADKIANVVKIIGQDKLIEKSYSENPQIDFIEQK